MADGKQRIPEALRQQVRERAQGRCEYCLVYDGDSIAPYHADHIIAEKHGGLATLENLAWACGQCNWHKGSDVGSIDLRTGRLVRFFDPRHQKWHRHFRVSNTEIETLTITGRVTARILQFNTFDRRQERAFLQAAGRYPPI